MSCLLEHQGACLPITAIASVQIAGVHFILAGLGPSILLIDESSGALIDRIRVFERNTVHGLHVLATGSLDAGNFYAKLLSWGGQSLRLVRLTLENLSTKKDASLSLASPECLCSDWILDIDSCVKTSDDTRQPTRCNVSLVTAHNTLYCAELPENASESAPIHLNEIRSSLKPILYSADIKWITPSRVLVAAGTVFGEIVVWSCQFQGDTEELSFSQLSTCVHHFFAGHEGSIFGVSISPEVINLEERGSRRFLASCSDDRTIRVWDISSLPPGMPKGGSLSMDRNIRGTGFGTYIGESGVKQDACLAKTWAHDSRIWGVRFLGEAYSVENKSLKIVSYSEDTTCQVWDFSFVQDTPRLPDDGGQHSMTAQLSHLKTYKNHTGKHVWSLASRERPSSFTVYSGGADGNLISFSVGRRGSDPCDDQSIMVPTQDIIDSLTSTSGHPVNNLPPVDVNQKNKKKKKKDEPKISGYSFVADNCFLAASSEGRVLLGYVLPRTPSQTGVPEGYQVSWENVAILDGVTAYSSIAADSRQQFGVIGAQSGDIWLYDHICKSIHRIDQVEGKVVGIFTVDKTLDRSDTDASRACSFAVSLFGHGKVNLFCVRPGESPRIMRRTEFALPPKFLVMAAEVVEATGQMLLSSRQGEIASYDLGTDSGQGVIEPSWCIRGVHSGDAVTSILNLKNSKVSDAGANYILTAGRDGYYCIHELISGTAGLRTVHRTSPLHLNLERAMLDISTNDLLLLGFRGTSFVLWNESTQTELMAVECGGVHRTWVYHSGKFGNLLVWNRAATFQAFPWTAPSHRTLRAGGHGREIKTMAVSTPRINITGKIQPILATGGEDTLIRLWMLDEETKTRPDGSFQCLRTLKHHEVGLQHLQWSSSGSHLFSSSGAEEFQVWRLRYISGFGIGVVAEGEYPKGQPHSDLRITHFHVVEVDVDDSNVHDAFLISMCYSNSAIKMFYYESGLRGCYYTLLGEGRYTSNCLTHIQMLFSTGQPCLITTATDGCIAIWDPTAALKPSFSISNGRVKSISSPAPISPISLTWKSQHHVHQSSIKSMTCLAVAETTYLIITGGDDNALAFSLLEGGTPITTNTEPHFSTATLLPDAHASAINDITILHNGPQKQEGNNGDQMPNIQVATSGNDQRLKVWMVHMALPGMGANEEVNSIRVALKEDVYVAVADLSSMGVVIPASPPGQDGSAQRLVLCGVGMDMWAVKQPWARASHNS